MFGARNFFLTAARAVIDPLFYYVTLLLTGNGTNGAQNNTFLDSSTNNFTITRNGNTTQGTFTPYGSNWSNYFNGTDAWLSIGSNAAFGMGTGDCTIECWYYPLNSTSGNQVLVDLRTTNTAVPFALAVANGTGAIYAYNGTVYSGTAVTNNAWNHVAFVRSGSGANNCKLYLNGSQVAQFTDTNNWGSAQTCAIGRNTAFNGEFAFGYISNVRIVKGSAVYTTAFTPPSAPLAVISGTSLLTCADNRFIDDSTNNFTITVNGSPSVQRFSPFNPTTPYAAGTIGGSGYFDGSGDYLLPASNAAFNFGTGDFTVEAWVYQPASGIQCVYDSRGSDASSAGFFFGTINTNFAIYTGGATVISTAMPLNAWTHFAVARSGSTWTLYKNGVSAGTYSSSANLTDANRQIGASTTVTSSSANYFTGYISDLRVVKGTAVYTTTFTPPTAPLTAITNTSLLLNFTNGGIIDNAMMNDLETVGNAQISTSVSKFGGGSLAFDGTGDYLVSNAATTDLYAFGTGDFTLEFWLYLNSASGVIILFDPRNSSETNCPVVYMSSGVLYFYVNNVNVITGATLSTSTWYHIAFARSGSSTRLFVNGTQSGSTYTDTNNYVCQSNRPIIGANGFVSGGGVGIYALNGYIDDLRITKYARYTANFTPPTAPFPLQ